MIEPIEPKPIQATVCHEGNIVIEVPQETLTYINNIVNDSSREADQVFNVIINVQMKGEKITRTLSFELPTAVVAMLLKNKQFPSDLVESMKSENSERSSRNLLAPTGAPTEESYSDQIKQMADTTRVEFEEETLKAVLKTLVISRMAEEQLS